VFSVFNAGLLDRTGEPVVLGLAVAYGGLAQLLAGMWEFRRGNTFGTMAFASYGAFWLSYWALQQFLIKQIPAGEVGNATALFFITWAIFTALLWIASVRTTAAVSVTLALLAVMFLLLGIGDAGAHTELVKIAGWFGIATAAAGLYAAFAALINSTYERTLLPLRTVRHGR
jgi:succinate-acetate transporter protein